MLRAGIDRKYAVVLLCIAIALLAAGIVFRPAQEERKRPLSERDIARLQRLTEQRRLRDLSSYLSDSADSVGDWLVSIEPGQHNGVLWDAKGLVLVAGDESTTRYQVVMPDGRHVDAVRRPVPLGFPVAVLTPTSEVQTAQVPRGLRPELGDWVLAVARNKTNDIVFAHGLYQGAVDARCGSFGYRAVQSSAPLSAALIGGGVFTLEGELLGFVADCDGRPIAVSASSIEQFLRKPASLNDQLEQEYGMRVVESPVVQINAIWKASIAETAGLRPGDIIVALGDRRLQSLQDLEPLAKEFRIDHTLQIQRGKRLIRVLLPGVEPQSEASKPSPQGITLGPSTNIAGVLVKAVAPDSQAALAGLRVGDIILQIQGRATQNWTSALDVLNKLNGHPALLDLERNGTQLEVLVSP